MILDDIGEAPPVGYGSKQAGSEVTLDLRNRFAKVDGLF
jgi:hypothetical protein